jgi:hypothetical protein
MMNPDSDIRADGKESPARKYFHAKPRAPHLSFKDQIKE